MTDAPTTWLLQKILDCATAKSLWFSDENVLHLLPDAQSWKQKPQVISNRWDVAEQAKQRGFSSQFTDFNLITIADNSVDHIFYRISKEKAVTHHLINEAQRVLVAGGTLWISGQKNEGIKTYIEKACSLFGCAKHIKKNGMSYSSNLVKKVEAGTKLDDENYHELRECLHVNLLPIMSKPGQFGWDKIDQGSKFLLDEITIRLQPNKTFQHYLDLGCGYGYLTIASQHIAIETRTLTDNNAAALITAKANCLNLNISADIVASDAGDGLKQKFDLILCNPPFHQGFNVDGDLTEKFLCNAQKLLSENGVAYFVVNQFVGLEKKALQFFKYVELIVQNKSYKIIELRKI